MPTANLLTHTDLKRIAQDWKNEHLASVALDKSTAQVLTVESYEDQLETIEILLSDYREEFALNDYRNLKPTASDLLATTTHTSEDVQRLSCELAAARIQVLEHQVMLSQGRPVQAEEVSKASASTQRETSSDTSLSQAFDAYNIEKLRNGDWNAKTQKEHQYSVRLLVELLCDKQISDVIKEDIRQVRSALVRLPKNISKVKEFEGKGVVDILALNITEGLISPTRVNHHLRVMSGFLHWCQLNGYIAENPIIGMISKRNRNARDERQPFDDSDVLKVLTHLQLSQVNDEKPHQFWIPRLGMYTGARLEELCQLHVGDIKKLNGSYCIDINASRSDQQLKNLQSPRIIPIHTSLVDSGFIDYIEKIKLISSDGLVFPELYKTEGKYSHNVSKWFSRVARKMDIEKGKTFHSYSHTIVDKLRDADTIDYVMKRILGHSTQSETHDRYGSNKNVAVLAKAINSVVFK